MHTKGIRQQLWLSISIDNKSWSANAHWFEIRCYAQCHPTLFLLWFAFRSKILQLPHNGVWDNNYFSNLVAKLVILFLNKKAHEIIWGWGHFCFASWYIKMCALLLMLGAEDKNKTRVVVFCISSSLQF